MIKNKAIIFDLETTRVFKKGQTQHIVEIGAVKLNIDGLPYIEDTFQIYVKPDVNISKSTRKFIGMREDDVRSAKPLSEAIDNLLQWIGTKDYYLCSWSDNDLKLIVKQCAYYDVSLKWLKNYNDIQKEVTKFLERKDRISVKNALKELNIEKYGRYHTGVDDAINEAKILSKCFYNIDLKLNDPSDNYFFRFDLYRTCKECREIKYYKEFPISSHKGRKRIRKVCLKCSNKSKNEQSSS